MKIIKVESCRNCKYRTLGLVKTRDYLVCSHPKGPGVTPDTGIHPDCPLDDYPEPEIKPCPWCGVVPTPSVIPCTDGQWEITCWNSDCPVDAQVVSDSKEEAIEAWDRRYDDERTTV
jgi:hypothetical protein